MERLQEGQVRDGHLINVAVAHHLTVDIEAPHDHVVELFKGVLTIEDKEIDRHRRPPVASERLERLHEPTHGGKINRWNGERLEYIRGKQILRVSKPSRPNMRACLLQHCVQLVRHVKEEGVNQDVRIDEDVLICGIELSRAN